MSQAGSRAMRRREFCSLLGAAATTFPLATWPLAARAQDWPNRPIRFIVPLAAGGGLDFVARVVGEHMSRELRQQVFVENRTGAGSRSASTRRSRVRPTA